MKMKINILVCAIAMLSACSTHIASVVDIKDGTHMNGLDIDRSSHCIFESNVYNLNSTVKSVGKDFVCENRGEESLNNARWFSEE
jgi:hypothetical protein